MSADLDLSVFHPDRPDIRKVLGDLEAEIMELIWSFPVDHRVTVRKVFEALYERRRIAYTTVMSTMARLARKKLLRVERSEQTAYAYYPTFTKDEFVSRFVGHILESLLVSFSESTLEHLTALNDPRAAARARELLEEIAKRRTTEESE